MALKKTLTGWDFCECPPCEERGNEIYPTTSDDQVIINELGSNLATWLNIGRDGTSYTSLYSWLQANYPNSSYTLPIATDSTLGGVMVDTTNLTISNDGVLSVDVSSLNIPSVGTATFSTSGTIKLGNSTTLTSNFDTGTISGQVHDAYSYSGHVYALPLRLDGNGRAGIAIPTGLFQGSGAKVVPNWTLDWSKKVTSVPTNVPVSQGTDTNYILLGNKNVTTSNGELGYDADGVLSTQCGYPRLALVAGDGITMKRFTNEFISQADNYWGDNITEILISATDTIYQPFTGADSTHAGEAGLVPAPLATDNLKYLKGNGTWSLISYNELTDKPSFAAFMIYKGTVDNYADLGNIYNPEIGWVYNVTSTGMNYAWDGIAWDALGTSFNIDTLSTTEHSSNASYAIKGSGYIGTATKFLKEDGSWDTPTDTTYSAATANDLGLIKIGYTNTTNTDLKPVELDSNNKAYVNISNGSLKNHEVTAINTAVWDEYSDHFDTLTVRCNISNENLTVVNIKDFSVVGNGYNTDLNVDPTINYTWNISTAGATNTIAVIDAGSSAVKGSFQLIINHSNGIEETHNVGFIIDTPPTHAFAWFSTCAWGVSLYETGTNNSRVYLTAPADFEGTVTITNKHLISHSGSGIYSMNGSTQVVWTGDTSITDGAITAIDGTLVSTPQYKNDKIVVPSGYKVLVDAFVNLNETPSVGDMLYDSEINDTLIHNLLTRVKSLELVVASIPTIPTTDPQTAGLVWNDNGVLKVSSGS